MLNSTENVTEVKANNTIDTAETLPPCGWKGKKPFHIFIQWWKYGFFVTQPIVKNIHVFMVVFDTADK